VKRPFYPLFGRHHSPNPGGGADPVKHYGVRRHHPLLKGPSNLRTFSRIFPPTGIYYRLSHASHALRFFAGVQNDCEGGKTIPWRCCREAAIYSSTPKASIPQPSAPTALSNFRTLAPIGRINLKNLFTQPFYTTCGEAASPHNSPFQKSGIWIIIKNGKLGYAYAGNDHSPAPVRKGGTSWVYPSGTY
jgi:hypothetical protein